MSQSPIDGPRDTVPMSIARRFASGAFEVANDTELIPAQGVAKAPDAQNSPEPVDPAEHFDPAELGRSALPSSRRKRPAGLAKARHEPTFRPGDQFRNYVVAGEFAQGGLSLLYEATHSSSLRRCLIKVLKPYYREPQFKSIQDKLFAEGELLMRAGGRNAFLVPVHDCGRDEVVGPFVIMDKLEGQTLHSLMQQQSALQATFEPASVARTGIYLAESLHTMHLLGAVHRDVKPLNIFIPDGRGGALQYVLLDWGCAKSVHSPHTSLEQSALGTAAYMAPEQILRGPISGAIDQYALAVVLVEMLWRHPFMEDGPVDAQGLVQRHLHVLAPEPPAHFVPKRLWSVLRRALEKDPTRRFGSCRLFGDALRDWLNDPDVRAKKPEQLLLAVRPTVPKPSATPKPPQAFAHALVDVPTPAKLVDLRALSVLPTLVIRSGKQAGARFELTGLQVVGRHPARAHIVLDDDGISNRHARLEGVVLDCDAPVFSVLDMGSTNGTAVAGIPLGSESDDAHAQVGTLQAGEVVIFDEIEAALMPAGRLGPNDEWQTPQQADAFDREARATPAGAPHDKLALPAAAPNARAANAASPALPHKPQRQRVAMGETWLVPTLVLLWENRGVRVVCGNEGIIGSSPEKANIVIDEQHVSAAHIHYKRTTTRSGGVGYLVEDLDSANGMRVEVDGLFTRVLADLLVPMARLWLSKHVEIILLPPGYYDAERVFVPVDEGGRRLRPNGALANADGRTRAATFAGLASYPRWAKAMLLVLTFVLVALLGLVVLQKVFDYDVLSQLRGAS